MLPALPARRSGDFPIRSDLTLLHEMAHAIRQMWGVWYEQPVDNGGYDWYMQDSEEYFATVVANMYASERGYIGRLTYERLNGIFRRCSFETTRWV